MLSTLIKVFASLILLVRDSNGYSQHVIKYNSPVNRNGIRELCAVEMDAFLDGLGNLDVWALTMLDASSKIPAGMLTGNIADFGNYDECLAIKHETQNFTIRGKHCSNAVNIPLDAIASDIKRISGQPNSTAQLTEDGYDVRVGLALCIPDACVPSEVAWYFNLENNIISDQMCQTYEETQLNGGDIAAISFLSIILFIMVVSTIYDFWLLKSGSDLLHPILIAFSVITNVRKLVTVDNSNARQLSSLHGIRYVSMLWIVAGHRYGTIGNSPALNAVDMLEWTSKLYTQYVQAAYLAVDTFFFLSGMMISYGYFRTANKPKSVSFVPLYYLHRYLRITPAVGVIFFMTVTIWRHLGSGPLWNVLTEYLKAPCIKWWWSFFLYVQNYVNTEDVCIVTTWYLSADMQMFLLSPFIMLPLGYLAIRTSKKMVYIASSSLVVAFMVIQLIITLNVESISDSMTHHRLSIWMIGFTLGILLEEIKSKQLRVRMNWIVNLVIWIVVLIGMVAIILTMHDVTQNPEKNKTKMFDIFHRPCWGLGLAWIVYSCTIGYGGFVNWFLSLPAFQVLSRLTYCMYLIHFFSIMLVNGQKRVPIYFSELNVIYYVCGDIVLTTIWAFVWVLAFESPMITIEKCIFDRNRESKSNDKTVSANAKADLNETTPKAITIES